MPLQPVSLGQVRDHLRLPEDDNRDDVLLTGYIAAARRASLATTGIVLDDILLPPDEGDVAVIAQAMLLTIAHWYSNREAVATDARSAPIEMPRSAGWLLGSIRMRSI